MNVGECANAKRVRVPGVALKGCVAGRVGTETDVMERLVDPHNTSAQKNQTAVRTFLLFYTMLDFWGEVANR